MKPRDPVPFEKVEQLAENIRNLRVLEGKKAATQAQLIRWCLFKLRQDAKDTTAYRQAQGITASGAATLAHREDQTKALLYLEHLATQLEDQSVRLPDNQPKEETPCS